MAAARKRREPGAEHAQADQATREEQQAQEVNTSARRSARPAVEKLAQELIDEENERLENKLSHKVYAAYKEKLGIAARKRKEPETEQAQADQATREEQQAQEVNTSARRSARPAVEKLAQELIDEENERLEDKLFDKVDTAYKERLGMTKPKSLHETGISSEAQEELQRLTNLSLNEIEALPQEKRELVWDELARQIVETPGFVDGMNAIFEIGKRTTATIDEWTPRFQQMAETATRTISGISAAMESIRKGIANLLSDDTIEASRTLETLAPYIEAEADERPEKYGENAREPASARDLIAAAARRARKDGNEIPPLKAEEPEQIQLELPTKKEADTDKREKQQPAEAPAEPSPLSLARKAGTITSLGDHVATIADKMLQYCFTSRDLKGLPGERDNFLFDSAGKLNEFSLNGQPLQPLDYIHTGFLMALLQMANICDIREYNSKDNPSLGVYLPAFFREAHIDPRPRMRTEEIDSATGETKKVLRKRQQRADDQTIKHERLQRFIEFMKPLDNRVGIIQGEGYYTDRKSVG